MIERLMAAAALILAAAAAPAQQVGTARTELQRHDLSVAGREAIQVRVDLAPGTTAPPAPGTRIRATS